MYLGSNQIDTSASLPAVNNVTQGYESRRALVRIDLVDSTLARLA